MSNYASVIPLPNRAAPPQADNTVVYNVVDFEKAKVISVSVRLCIVIVRVVVICCYSFQRRAHPHGLLYADITPVAGLPKPSVSNTVPSQYATIAPQPCSNKIQPEAAGTAGSRDKKNVEIMCALSKL